MFTDDDKKELARLMQKRRRATESGTRRAMIAWNTGEKGKAAAKKYAPVKNAKRAVGTESYLKDKRKDSDSIACAEHHRHNWTCADETALLEMHNEGKTAKEIASTLGRSIRAVERKREKLKASNASLRGRLEAATPPEAGPLEATVIRSLESE